jgi:hypothetical protein
MSTLDEIRAETEHLKGTLVLDHFKVVLFLNVIDRPDDYYYELVEPHKAKSYWTSCVGPLFSLKDQLSKQNYNYLVDVWNLNSEFKADVQHQET